MDANPVLQTEEPVTLREELEKQFDAAESSNIAPDANVRVGETESQREARVRDEKGRFAQAVPAEQVRPPRPSSWKKEYWEQYDKLDPKLATYINQREGEYASGVSTYKAEAEKARELQDAVAPFLPDLQQSNIHPTTFIRNLGTAHSILVKGSPQDKLGMIAKLAQDYNIPLQALFNQAQQQPAQQMPDVGALVRQELETVQSQREVQNFIKEAATKYPHFEAVKETMIGLLRSELAQDLDSAYSKAIRMNDDVWKAEQERVASQATAEHQRLAAEKVAKARSRTVSVRSETPASAGSSTGAKDRRSQIADAFDNLESRV